MKNTKLARYIVFIRRRKNMLDKKKIKELEQKLETISEEMIALEDTKLATEKELDRLSRDTSIELPEPGTMFYSVLDNCEISEYEYDREYSDGAYLLGRLFETTTEAHRELRVRQITFQIKKWAEAHNDGWAPDWSDGAEYKWYVMYDSTYNCLTAQYTVDEVHSPETIYFKDGGIAQKCIELFRDEWFELFGAPKINKK